MSSHIKILSFEASILLEDHQDDYDQVQFRQIVAEIIPIPLNIHSSCKHACQKKKTAITI